MFSTHRQVAIYQGNTIYQRLPGFEFTPILLGKIASYIVQAPDGQCTVFAFMYPLLAAWAGDAIDEGRLLADAVRTIERAIAAPRLGIRRDFTYEYHADRYAEVEQPAWWIPTAP